MLVKRKTVTRSKTAMLTVATAAGYKGVRYLDGSNEIATAVLVVGATLVMIALRASIIRLFDDLSAHQEGEKDGAKLKLQPPKPIYRSMTAIIAILTCGGYFAAGYLEEGAGTQQIIVALGIAGVIVYMRRALIAVFDEI